MNTVVLQKSLEIYLSLSGLITSWPKKERHTLGIRVETQSLLLIEQIVSAEQSLPILKDRYLFEASVKAEILKILLRCAVLRQLIKETNYFTLAGKLVEIGKMIGGWIKSLRR